MVSSSSENRCYHHRLTGYRNHRQFATQAAFPQAGDPGKAQRDEVLPHMLAWLRKGSDRRQVARSFYGSSVTQARAAVFYADWGVPDTLAGRFEMVVLHLALVLRRLGAEGEAGQPLAQALTEAFVVDMDDNMRELTFSDLRVPKEIKRATAALFDRHAAYLAALTAAHDISLADALAAQLAYLDPDGRLDARRLADYVRRCAAALDAEPAAQVLGGRLAWPRLAGQE
jgi:cytochrome b pre-mRNA-processing protein 3